MAKRTSMIVFLIAAALFFAVEAQAGIILKVIAVNPSKMEKQKVQVKAYLPKEVKPEDLTDKSDLDIAYDNQQGSYYVFGEYELKPGEVVEKTIEMSDIWVIPASEIESLRQESDKTCKMLENTDFKDRMAFLKQSMDVKLADIERRQKVPAVSPEKHISDYRENEKLLESVKADLVVARSLLAQAKPVPPAHVWKLIVVIVIFLGVIGGSSFLIWQAQIKAIDTSADQKKNTDEPDAARPEKDKPHSGDAGKPDDIEKIIKGEG